MTRPKLAQLDGRSFDVAVVGAGANGASAAQHLAAAGYDVLLVDKGDYGSGSSSRSSRLLHCGLRYLAPGGSMWDFVRHPNALRIALTMARKAMECRAQLVETAPERTQKLNFCFPIFDGGPYKPWQVSLAMRLLERLGPSSVPLDYRNLAPKEVAHTPLVRWLRDQDKLRGLAMFREYRYEWPERIIADAVLDAERMGAVARNYTAVTAMAKAGDGWRLTLADPTAPGATATVVAKLVLNMAGIWIDRVNALAKPGAKRRINGTKGSHIVVRLPADCAEYGIATINRENEPFYCIPWRGLHFFGPTETLYDGDPDDVRVTDDEVDWLIAEANYMLPALGLRREHVIFSWAGVRPLGADPDFPKGKRSREVHDLAADGMPGVYAMTAGPIMTHRSAGPEMVDIVASKIAPRRARQALSYAAAAFPENQNSPPLLDHDTRVKLSDLKFAATREHATSLIDILFRRVPVGWTEGMAHAEALKAAQAVAPELGWDQQRIDREVQAYRAHIEQFYRVDPRGRAIDVEPRSARP
ncbi:MAG: FAD-dependent oxidoreductase [Alphaproteobacteria bacterium]|nr:FAD-dependent oxidoreductase [Alphaproteobacteria bacterium]